MMAGRTRSIALAALLLLGAAPPAEPGPLGIHGNRTTFEIAPVLLAAERLYGDAAAVKMGGIPNLFGAPGIPGFASPGKAELATHADTQALRYSVDHPDLRIILTVAEGHYRLLARRSAGIASVKDLRGKRIATIPTTSSGYFLHRLLETAGLKDRDVTMVPISPLSAMPAALKDGRVDAMTIWEPEIEKAAQLLGADGISLSGHGVYRELFGLNSNVASLSDPATRARVVEFVAATLKASADIRADPALGQAQVRKATGEPAAVVAASWPHQTFPATLVPDLLDTLVAEERWLAERDKRPVRDRAALARLIDPSILAEARAQMRIAR